MKDILLTLELSLLKEDVRTSYKKLDELLHDDFLEYGTAGKIYTKHDVLIRLPTTTFLRYTLSDFEIFKLTPEIFQTRFKIERLNQDNTITVSLRSSIWKNENNDWKIIFHQGTKSN